MHNQESRDQFCSSVFSIERKTPSGRDMKGTIKGSTCWHVLHFRWRLGVRTEHEEAFSAEKMRGIFVCLQSGERTHVERRSQFGRGAGVGSERGGGWGGGVRRRGGR